MLGLVAAGPAVAVALSLAPRAVSALRGAGDETKYHLPTILRFAAELPRPDLTNYGSATTPGYHLCLAVVARLLSDDPTLLRLAALGFSVGLGLMLGLLVCRGARGPSRLALAAMPVMCSMYVVSSAARLLPDNAGWLGVAALLALALRWPGGWRGAVLAGALLTATVAMRQIHLWAIAPVWVAAWLSADRPSDSEAEGLVADAATVFSRGPRRLRAVGPSVLAALPAVGLLAWLASMWGGLTPPSFQAQHNTGLAWAGPAFLLSVVGIFSVAYAGCIAGALLDLWHRQRGVLVAAGILGVALGLVPPTAADRSAGRTSGLWSLAEVAPQFAGRSLLIAGLAGLGGLMVAAWAQALPRRDRWIALGGLVAFGVAHLANPQIWQRYYEPFVLLLLAMMAGGVAARRALPKWWVVGPLVLAMGLGAATAWKAWSATAPPLPTLDVDQASN